MNVEGTSHDPLHSAPGGPPGGYGPPPGGGPPDGYGPPPGGAPPGAPGGGGPPGGYGPPPGGYGPPPGFGGGVNPYAPPQPGFMPGPYDVPMQAPSDAKQALIYALVGLFCCNIIFGPLAIIKARSAKQIIALNPGMPGEGMATAGMIIGIIDVVLFFVGLFIRFAH